MNIWGELMSGTPEDVYGLLTGDGSGDLEVGHVACAAANGMSRIRALGMRLDEVDAAYGRLLAVNARQYKLIARLFGRIKRIEREVGFASYPLGEGFPETDGEL